MPLSNCKVELKLKCTNHCFLTVVGNNNTNANDNNIAFTIEDLVFTLSAKDNEKLSKLLSKGFERSVY